MVTEDHPFEKLIQHRRPAPALPMRIGRHDVLVESTPFGTSVYQIRGERVLTLRANEGYREDVVAALLDAVADWATADLGPVVRLRPIDVPGFPLDRAALLGPGETHFFRNRPELDGRGFQVVPVHRSEAADGENTETFRQAVFGSGLGIRELHWTRVPVPRTDLLRLDSGLGGPFRRNRNSRRNVKPLIMRARAVLEDQIPALPPGCLVLLRDMRGHELELHREWDRLRGTLRAPGGTGATTVDIPRLAAWPMLGPLFEGADATPAAPTAPPEEMLEVRVSIEGGSYDQHFLPRSRPDCVQRLRTLPTTDGTFMVCAGRSGGVVQVMWHAGPRLWLETPEPEHHRSRGRYVTLDEAERMMTILAREDRVAVDELGNLTTA